MLQLRVGGPLRHAHRVDTRARGLTPAAANAFARSWPTARSRRAVCGVDDACDLGASCLRTSGCRVIRRTPYAASASHRRAYTPVGPAYPPPGRCTSRSCCWDVCRHLQAQAKGPVQRVVSGTGRHRAYARGCSTTPYATRREPWGRSFMVEGETPPACYRQWGPPGHRGGPDSYGSGPMRGLRKGLPPCRASHHVVSPLDSVYSMNDPASVSPISPAGRISVAVRVLLPGVR